MRFRPTTYSISVLACTFVIGGCSQSSSSTTVPPTTQKESPQTDPPTTHTESPQTDPTKLKQSAPAERLIHSFYSVDHYDKSRDPSSDLAKTLEIAKKSGKHVLLQVGGDWCIWCARVNDYMNTNETVHQILKDNFVVMKVTYPGDKAEAFLKQFPKCVAYPHFFVIQNDGEFLHSQDAAGLIKEESYDQEAFVRFLESWTPSTTEGNTLNKNSSGAE
ncbi:MAG: thioredoxin family protein [Planctomycetaceae bacterium]|nr:thioredoxin family protein [Planctomycetaceae bacterium]